MNKKSILITIISVLALSTSYNVSAEKSENKEKDNFRNHKHSLKYKKSHSLNTLGYEKFKQMTKAMGGMQKILSFEGIQFTSNGYRVEPEQRFKPNSKPLFVQNYIYTLTNSLKQQRSITQWFHNSQFPITTTRDFSEIINGEHGAVFGLDTVIASSQAPMLSTRLGARVKQNLLSSPLALIHHINRNIDTIRFSGIKKFNHKKHYVISVSGWDQPIRLFINSKTNLLSKVDTLEDDSVYGDTRWGIIFNHWIDVDNIKLPSTVVHRINGRKINSERRNAFTLKK